MAKREILPPIEIQGDQINIVREASKADGITSSRPSNQKPFSRTEIEKIVKEEFNYTLLPLHEQFKERMETDHENKLAQEIRQVYCEVSNLKRNQVINLAQTNDLLAAATLNLPECSRLQGLGQTLLLQQCQKKRVNVTAVETKCGFQPFFE